MITFSCPCGMKFKVKPEFAGRKATCPTCKQQMIVPAPSKTEAVVPSGPIDGTPSSVHQAGVEGGVTLGHAGQKSIQELLARQSKKGQRYIVQNEIARGGMGVVLLAYDYDLRREVAIKFMLKDSDPKQTIRFTEEAQITGQLEHPNIVPIHELGLDAHKRLFFSMKMVRGRSLKEVVDMLRDNPKQAEKDYYLGKLLTIFVSVCNGMAYAHSRGVVHRDLKPANIMTGDFGEVYVMDWGLAKVLNLPEAQVVAAESGTRGHGSAFSGAPGATPPASAVTAAKVSTSREPEADLTQDGAIVGTPVYMPPEQALGNISDIDERSDIYSLGAILYELLTLQPPIDKEGGHMSILMRVSMGEIASPEVRNRKRTIPREVSAIAMKALAKEKKDRYQSVEALRRDIELFQEGRSVSAKEDTRWEMMVKFVKRNKGFSAAAAVAILILLWSSVINYQERVRAETAQAAYRKEQGEKDRRTREAVPVFIEAARLAVDQKRFANALTQLDVALTYEPDQAEARLFKGQLLLAHQDFAAARVELELYLQLKPSDADTAKLARLCATSKPDDPVAAADMANILVKQNQPMLALGMYRSNEKQLEIYRKKIEAAWPGLGRNLTLNKDFKLRLSLGYSQVIDLSPLKSIPLSHLDIHHTKVRDLAPLTGMPLTSLGLGDCDGITDLSPIKGMPLTSLGLGNCDGITDLSPLKGMPLTWLHLGGGISDLSLLKGMPLTSLNLYRCGKIRDLTPLRGLMLTFLNLGECNQIRDLTPLQGMPLNTLIITTASSGQIQNLTPLQGMPLTVLSAYGHPIKDLTPLDGMQLEDFRFTPKTVTKGVEGIRRMMSLKTIGVSWEPEKNFAPAEFWRRYDTGEFNK